MSTQKTRHLGAIDVSAIGHGCMQMAGRGPVEHIYRSKLDEVSAAAVVNAARAGGINWFDTAEAYGKRRGDGLLAAVLRETDRQDGQVLIATKWNPLLRGARTVELGIDPRLRALRQPILHQIHWPVGSWSTMQAQLRQMARLYHDEVIKAVGVSNFSATQMRKAHARLHDLGVPLATNQVQVSLLHRSIESNGVFKAARELGVTLIAYFPLKAGLLTGRFHDKPAQLTTITRMRRAAGITRSAVERSTPLIGSLRTIGESHDATPAQVALAWVTSFYGEHVVAIPGASTAEQAASNAAAMHVQLTDDELKVLADQSAWALR